MLRVSPLRPREIVTRFSTAVREPESLGVKVRVIGTLPAPLREEPGILIIAVGDTLKSLALMPERLSSKGVLFAANPSLKSRKSSVVELPSVTLPRSRVSVLWYTRPVVSASLT